MSDKEPMRRTAGVSYEPEDRADVLDFIADYSYDAVDAGVHPTAVISALDNVRDEIREAQQGGKFDEKPTRSEAADFGEGESTGVQDL